jgi:lipopolysaccharide/colanic/teichoic acid biosynthesis glycosyltransferase
LRADRFHLTLDDHCRDRDQVRQSGPILERRCCIGIGGRRFDALRFRTILRAEDADLAWHRASQLTRVGPYLRYIGIDDLPQLFNVLRGEMSIIDSGAYSPSFLD